MKKKLPLEITDKATEKIMEIKKQKEIDDSYLLRLGVKPSGCGIASHIIGFDHATEKDEIFDHEGIKIIIEKMQMMYLAGKSIDYGNFNGEVGFVFRDTDSD